MPLNVGRLAKLTHDRVSVTIDFGEAGALQVEYYPQRLTTRMILDLADSGQPGTLTPDRQIRVMASAATILTALLASWDLTATNADGLDEPVPLDAAHIEQLELNVAWQILNGILSAQTRGKAPAPEDSASAPASGAA